MFHDIIGQSWNFDVYNRSIIIVNLIKGIGASIENDKDLDKLISAVASKKGTTEAGLKSFKTNKLNKIFEEGLKAAIKRSEEMSNEY